MNWLVGDLPSWLAVLIALGAIWVTWRAVRARSYIEVPDWDAKVDDKSGDIEVRCRVKLITNTVHVEANGEITFGLIKSNKIKLLLDRSEDFKPRPHEQDLYLKGHTDLKFTKRKKGKLKLNIILSDGSNKKAK